MPLNYASYAEYTAVYSDKGLTQAEVESAWLIHGALRVNEALGGLFTTPFSSNNATARELSIHYAQLGIRNRTRNARDSDELRTMLNDRITAIMSGTAPMILDDGTALQVDAKGASTGIWSNTQGYKPIFDMRDPTEQRVDPDRLVDEDGEDS